MNTIKSTLNKPILISIILSFAIMLVPITSIFADNMIVTNLYGNSYTTGNMALEPSYWGNSNINNGNFIVKKTSSFNGDNGYINFQIPIIYIQNKPSGTATINITYSLNNVSLQSNNRLYFTDNLYTTNNTTNATTSLFTNNGNTLTCTTDKTGSFYIYLNMLARFTNGECQGTYSYSYNITLGDNTYSDIIKIDTPSVNIQNNKIVWFAIDNATSYNVRYWDSSYNNGNGRYVTNVVIPNENETLISYDVSQVATYNVQAVTNLSGYTNSDWSSGVYFTGEYSSQLATPTIYRTDNVLKWSPITNASYYQVYKNGFYIQNSKDVPYLFTNVDGYICFSVNDTGDYQVQSCSTSNGVSNSNLSNTIQYSNVNTTNPNYPSDTPTTPTEPTNSNVIEWIMYFINLFVYYVSSFANSVLKLIQNSINSIALLIQYITSFVSWFGHILDFMPSELKSVFISIITILGTISVIKAIK